MLVIAITTLLTHSVLAANNIDALYINAKVYTVDSSQPWAEAFAVKEGKFFAVGKTQDIIKLKSKHTRIIDLQGKFVMPGLIDEHLHPDMGADNYLNVFIAATDNWQQVSQKLKNFRAKNPDKKWIYGSTIDWLLDDNGIIANYGVPSNKSVLDKIINDRPVALWDQGAHAMLLNSMALDELGISDQSANPKGGIFVKDQAGKLTGVIRETACTLVVNALDNYSEQQWREKGLIPFLNEMSSYGLTGLNDAYIVEKNAQAFYQIEMENKLNQWINFNIATPLEFNDPKRIEAQQELIKNSKKFQTKHINVAGIKYILDGSAAGKTAAMIEPFEGDTINGSLRYPKAELIKDIKKHADQGFSIKAHAIGDRGIRLLLDIFAQLPKRDNEALYSVAHGTFVNPDDINRFAPLNVVYEASPALWYPNNAIPIIKADIGKRTRYAWPISKLIENKTIVSYGSDWPVSVTPNPWPGLESMITRQLAGGSKEAFNPQYAINLETAIQIFTLNGAIAMGIQDKTGSIKQGKYADFIVIDKNIFNVDKYELHKTKISATYFNGKKVYSGPLNH